jgi:hypothetical protein
MVHWKSAVVPFKVIIDKGRFGRIVPQKMADRQEIALFSNAFLHNLYVIRINPKIVLSQCNKVTKVFSEVKQNINKGFL